jgi:SAM-dependent methyltransferase
MLEVARERESERCRFVQGRAEALPLPDGAFDRALMKLVVHLIDRPRGFAEVRRVLRDDAALLVSTIDPEGFASFWLADWFPSYADVDRGRIPAPDVLVAELEEAGFARVEVTGVRRREPIPREHALAMIRGRFASSFAHMDDAEYEAGLARAEREMPESVVSDLRLLDLRCDTR